MKINNINLLFYKILQTSNLNQAFKLFFIKTLSLDFMTDFVFMVYQPFVDFFKSEADLEL